MKKNGFTLVELLAVIIVLGIIAVITIPKISEQIEKSKQNLAIDSALSYKKTIDEYYLHEQMNKNDIKLDGIYNINESGNIYNENEEHKINISGKTPESGILSFYNDELSYACITLNNYKITIRNDETTVEKGECTTISPESYFSYEEDENGKITILGLTNEYESSNDKTIVIPATINNKPVTKIGNIELSETDIETIIMPNSIVDIDRYAFQHSNLKTIILSKSLERINTNQFTDTEIEEIIIPGSVNSIGNYAFTSCSSLKKLTIENGVSSIGQGILSDSKIEEITIPESIQTLDYSAFSNIETLKKATIGAKTIEAEAFKNTGLKEVTLTNNVETIKTQAFYGSSGIEKLTLSNNLKTIGTQAFYEIKVSEITIPDSVEEIGTNAFGNIESLKKLTIGKNVTTIGNMAFSLNSGKTDRLETIINKSNIDLENGTYLEGRSNYTITNQ